MDMISENVLILFLFIAVLRRMPCLCRLCRQLRISFYIFNVTLQKTIYEWFFWIMKSAAVRMIMADRGLNIELPLGVLSSHLYRASFLLIFF